MKTLLKIALTFSLCISVLQFINAQTTYVWTGGTSNWNNAANWTPNGLPTAVDTVDITNDGTYTVTLDVDASVAKIRLGGSADIQILILSSKTLNIETDFIISPQGKLSLQSSTIAGNGSILNDGTILGNTATFDINLENRNTLEFTYESFINKAFITQPDSKILMKPGNRYTRLILMNGFTNHGLIDYVTTNYYGSCDIQIKNGTLINAPDGMIKSTGIPLAYVNRITAPLDNQGAISIDQTFNLGSANATHTNSGSMLISNNSLTITGTSFYNSGILSLDSTATLFLNGASFDYFPGTFDFKGKLEANNADLHFPESITVPISIKLSNSTMTCDSTLINPGTITLSHATLSCNHTILNLNTISVSTSTISGTDTLINEGTIQGNPGTFDINLENRNTLEFTYESFINKAFITQPDSKILMKPGNSYTRLILMSGFTNHGLIEYVITNKYGSGDIQIQNGTLINAPDGIIQSTGIALVYVNKITAPLDNQGSISIDQTFNLGSANATHKTSGSMLISNNSLTVTGTSFYNSGTLSLDSTATLILNGASFDYFPGTFDFKGKLEANNADLHFPESITVPISIKLSNSTMTCDSTLINPGTITLSHATISCNHTILNLNTISVSTSTISGTDTLINEGTIQGNSGTFDIHLENRNILEFTNNNSINKAIITHPNTKILIKKGRITLMNGFTNHGLIEYVTTNYYGYGDIQIKNGTLINAHDGIIKSTGIALAYSNRITGPLDNQGAISIDQTFMLGSVNATHKNSGSMMISNNLLTVTGTSFQNQPGGKLMGTGTLDISALSFSNAGQLSPGLSPGILNIKGDLPLETSSILKLELGGKDKGALYDNLNITGSASLQGILRVHLIDSFIPEVGDEFEIVNFAASSGAIDSTVGLYVGNDVILNLVPSASNLKLTTTPHTNRVPIVENPLSDVILNEDEDTTINLELDQVFRDEDFSLGDTLIFSFAINNDKVWASLDGDALIIKCNKDSNGITTVIITATDIDNESVTDTFQVEITPVNDVPQIKDKHQLSDLVLNEDFEETSVADLETVFVERDMDDRLDYTVSSLKDLLLPTITNNVLSFMSKSNQNGMDSIIVTATDTSFASISDTFVVTIQAVNDAPSKVELIGPEHQTVFLKVDTIEFTWTESVDIENDPITYQLMITGSDWDTTLTNILDTMVLFINKGVLDKLTTYDWTITAVDEQSANAISETYSFTTPLSGVGLDKKNNTGYQLAQNFPNPFSSETIISFSIPRSEKATLKIYNLKGKEITTLFSGRMPAGSHSFTWDGSDMKSGIYVYQLRTKTNVFTKRMLFIK